jgi:hypothetical protein
LVAGVRTNDVKLWRDSFVEALKTAKEPPLPLFPSPTAAILRDKAAEIPERMASRRIRQASRRPAFRQPQA